MLRGLLVAATLAAALTGGACAAGAAPPPASLTAPAEPAPAPPSTPTAAPAPVSTPIARAPEPTASPTPAAAAATAAPSPPVPSPTPTARAAATAPATATATPAPSATPTATRQPSPTRLAPASPLATATTTATAGRAAAAPSPSPGPGLPGAAADVGLDPGHHRLDVGAVGGGLREHELTLELARRARARLEAHGLRVALSRASAEPVSVWTAPDPTDRVRLEQEARIRAVGRVRVYVSIHLNAFSDPGLAGTETYYNADNQGAASRRLAGELQAGVLRRLAAAGYAARDRGVKEDLAAGKPYGHFFSLRGGAPSALVEALFLSSPADAAALAREAIREAIARGVADGVLAYLR